MFSKYEIHTTVQSRYCYPDSDVLKNKLNIRDKAELKRAEEDFTAVKQLVLLQNPLQGRFTKKHLTMTMTEIMNTMIPGVWKGNCMVSRLMDIM